MADIGCGLGASNILMAKEYPHSEFFGFDYHAGPYAEDATEANLNPVGRATQTPFNPVFEARP